MHWAEIAGLFFFFKLFSSPPPPPAFPSEHAHHIEAFWFLHFSHNLASEQLTASSGQVRTHAQLLPSADRTVNYKQAPLGNPDVNKIMTIQDCVRMFPVTTKLQKKLKEVWQMTSSDIA